uniref:Uncharacterized protein n=1 Tax=Tetranychus urticae TaxID=32264 RepID=T1KC11_TETUR
MPDTEHHDITKETLETQYEHVVKKVASSHPQQYGDKSLANLVISQFQGTSKSQNLPKEPMDSFGRISQRDEALHYWRRRLESASENECNQVRLKLSSIIAGRRFYDMAIRRVIGRLCSAGFYTNVNSVLNTRSMLCFQCLQSDIDKSKKVDNINGIIFIYFARNFLKPTELKRNVVKSFRNSKEIFRHKTSERKRNPEKNGIKNKRISMFPKGKGENDDELDEVKNMESKKPKFCLATRKAELARWSKHREAQLSTHRVARALRVIGVLFAIFQCFIFILFWVWILGLHVDCTQSLCDLNLFAEATGKNGKMKKKIWVHEEEGGDKSRKPHNNLHKNGIMCVHLEELKKFEIAIGVRASRNTTVERPAPSSSVSEGVRHKCIKNVHQCPTKYTFNESASQLLEAQKYRKKLMRKNDDRMAFLEWIKNFLLNFFNLLRHDLKWFDIQQDVYNVLPGSIKQASQVKLKAFRFKGSNKTYLHQVITGEAQIEDDHCDDCDEDEKFHHKMPETERRIEFRLKTLHENGCIENAPMLQEIRLQIHALTGKEEKFHWNVERKGNKTCRVQDTLDAIRETNGKIIEVDWLENIHEPQDIFITFCDSLSEEKRSSSINKFGLNKREKVETERTKKNFFFKQLETMNKVQG